VKFRFETIETIEIVHHRVYDANTQKSVFRTDTFLKGKFVVARQVPQPELQFAPEPTDTKVAGMTQPTKTAKGSKAKKSTAPTTAAIASAQPAPAESAPVPQSSVPGLTGKAEDGQNLESLSSHKTSSKQFKLWDADKFNAAINKFKFNLRRFRCILV
jgi:hypothetical protein